MAASTKSSESQRLARTSRFGRGRAQTVPSSQAPARAVRVIQKPQLMAASAKAMK